MCATMKYVSWMCRSTGVAAMKIPDRPPITNMATNEIAKHIGTVNRICARHSVASQLNVLMAEGSAIIIVESMKVMPRYGFMPLWNMWWPHTMNPSHAIAAIEYTIGR
jgi:hypothetical protein